MRFLLTMNMPSYAGNLVHQINAEHTSNSLEEFVEALTREDFVIVEEFYKDPKSQSDFSRGKMAINHRYVGKIKILDGDISTYRKD